VVVSSDETTLRQLAAEVSIIRQLGVEEYENRW